MAYSAGDYGVIAHALCVRVSDLSSGVPGYLVEPHVYRYVYIYYTYVYPYSLAVGGAYFLLFV